MSNMPKQTNVPEEIYMEGRLRFNIGGYPPGTPLYDQMVKERKTFVYIEESDQALRTFQEKVRKAAAEDMAIAAIRWCNNILTEVVRNYERRMPPKALELMEQGISILRLASEELRKA